MKIRAAIVLETMTVMLLLFWPALYGQMARRAQVEADRQARRQEKLKKDAERAQKKK